MKRNPDDPRLPAFSQGEWTFDDKPKRGQQWQVVNPEGYQVATSPGPNSGQPELDEQDRINMHLIAAAPDLLACVFGLLTNFPGLLPESDWKPGDNENLVAWLEDQAPYWRDALKKAGVDLKAKS